MLEAYLPLFVAIVAAVGLAGLMAYLGMVLGPKRPTSVKQENFECGNVASGDARERINIKFYLVGIMFLIFDIEAVFIYPWAVTFFDSIHSRGLIHPGIALAAMVSFIAVVVVGLVYAWRKGALEWNTGS